MYFLGNIPFRHSLRRKFSCRPNFHERPIISNHPPSILEFSRKDRFSTVSKALSPSSRPDKRRNRGGEIGYRLLLLRNGAECNYSPQTDSQFTNLRGAEIVDLRLTRPRNRINRRPAPLSKAINTFRRCSRIKLPFFSFSLLLVENKTVRRKLLPKFACFEEKERRICYSLYLFE